MPTSNSEPAPVTDAGCSSTQKSCVFRIKNLSWRYRHFGGLSAPALHQLTVEIPTGTTAVLGMSGSGKTTLLNLLGLLLEPSLFDWSVGQRLKPGNIVYYSPKSGDLDYKTLRPANRNQLRLWHFGFVLQSAYLLPNFSCAYNIQLPLRLQGKKASERTSRLDQLIKEVDPQHTDLRPHLGKFPNQVSGGERQRMAVLRAIIHDPDVIFADEPSASLDPFNTLRVASLLKNWQTGQHAGAKESDINRRTLLYVSHDTEAASRVADQFLLMRNGTLVENRLLTRADLADDLKASEENQIQCCVRKIKKLIDQEHACTLKDLSSPHSVTTGPEQNVPDTW